MKNILVLHGPNLNLLGRREKDIYGQTNLDTINSNLQTLATDKGYNLISFQSNSESALIEQIHNACNYDYIIFNPAAYTHTSIALRDALLAINIPFIEVHISNIYNREDFRKISYFSDIAMGVISGFGTYGYTMALNVIFNHFQS